MLLSIPSLSRRDETKHCKSKFPRYHSVFHSFTFYSSSIGNHNITNILYQGLDIGRLSEQGRFAFIDGLSELFHSSTPTPAVAPSPFTAQPAAVPSRGTLPVRSAPGTLRTPAQPAPAVGKAPSGSEPVKRLRLSGRGQAALDTLEKDIVAVINGLKGKKGPGNDDESEILLIIDQPDLVLAATGLSHGISATDMGEWIMGLQQVRRAF